MTKIKNYYAIIVAGGSGNRMQQDIPKQFLLLNEKPVLMHTMEAFYRCILGPEILLVLNIGQHDYWKRLCERYNFNLPHRVVEGGEQRFHSVKNALEAIKGEGIVAVHDAVRPLISTELITIAYQVADEKGNCVAGITPTDSVRRTLENGENEVINRDELTLIQTPQTFDVQLLKNAYHTPYVEGFTDDASVVGNAGVKINLIAGERENIKITYPEDLQFASLIMSKNKNTG